MAVSVIHLPLAKCASSQIHDMRKFYPAVGVSTFCRPQPEPPPLPDRRSKVTLAAVSTPLTTRVPWMLTLALSRLAAVPMTNTTPGPPAFTGCPFTRKSEGDAKAPTLPIRSKDDGLPVPGTCRIFSLAAAP